MLLVVVGIHQHGQHDLANVGAAFDAVGAFFGLFERRKKDGNQERDNGNDHKQFDKCESTFATHKRAFLTSAIFTRDERERKIYHKASGHTRTKAIQARATNAANVHHIVIIWSWGIE